jgi:riboflavin biosynthesis pyrimidine reductase
VQLIWDSSSHTAGEDGAVNVAAQYPWPDRPWVRALMVSSLDGSFVDADGRSEQLSGAADRLVLAAVRRFSSAVVVGAGTVRAEKYRPLRVSSDANVVTERLNRGLASAPTLVILSRSLHLPWAEPVFTEAAYPPIVITTAGDGADDRTRVRRARIRAGRYAEVVVLDDAPNSDVSNNDADCDTAENPHPAAVARAAVTHVHQRGLRRVVLEGGPALFAAMTHAAMVDEVDLTVSPVLNGGGQTATMRPLKMPERFELAHVLTGDGYLFTRYVKQGAS